MHDSHAVSVKKLIACCALVLVDFRAVALSSAKLPDSCFRREGLNRYSLQLSAGLVRFAARSVSSASSAVR